MREYYLLLLFVLFYLNIQDISGLFAKSRLFPLARGLRMSVASDPSTVPFKKYQGLGNDFILVDNTKSLDPIFTPKQAEKICDRNFGVGGDGVIFAMPGKNGCDYTMRIYNSDGSEPQMCGNGIRCMAKFLREIENKSSSEEVSYKIWTNAGIIIPRIQSNGAVTVDMGTPILKASQVPTLCNPTKDDMAIESDVDALGQNYKVTCVSMGNPHVIIYVDDLKTMNPPFNQIGPVMESHPKFPERVNAEFVQVCDIQRILRSLICTLQLQNMRSMISYCNLLWVCLSN